MLTCAILMTSSQSKARYVLPFVSLFNGVSPEGWDMLTPLNTRVAGSFKANALDQLICKVKDCFSSVGTVVDSSTGGSVEIRKPLPTENLLEDTDGLLRPPPPPTHQRPLGAVACCSRFLLTCALLLMTSSHSKAGRLFL